eukprot:UN11870
MVYVVNLMRGFLASRIVILKPEVKNVALCVLQFVYMFHIINKRQPLNFRLKIFSEGFTFILIMCTAIFMDYT